MNAIRRFFKGLYSAPFHLALVAAFTLVSAFTIGVGSWAISYAINEYLVDAMNERVARDIRLAQAIYGVHQDEVEGIAQNLALDQTIISNLSAADGGDKAARQALDARVTNLLGASVPSGKHAAALLTPDGKILTALIVSASGERFAANPTGEWDNLPIFRAAMTAGGSLSATEVIPGELLEQIGLAEQARINLIETPKAAPTPFDPREGAAGLALVSVVPIKDKSGQIIGAALCLHVFNNDFALVDRIKDIAGIDTVTIFLGDLRISTNVLNAEGNRAVGTRLSAGVGDVVLKNGREYVGTAFVVNENYITRYTPLRNHAGRVVGVLNVGAKQTSFLRLVDEVRRRIMLAAIVMVLLIFLLATPVTRVITNPLAHLRELAQVSKRVAQGETTLRMPVYYGGEVRGLATEFNRMLDTLYATQEQLVQSEKLVSLGQLAAGVAHEINNPLGTILLYSESALNECAEEDPHRADLSVIVSETKRCKRIVAGLLNFSRQHQVVAQPTDINALLQELIDMAPRRIKTVPINVVGEFDPNLPIIDGDAAQLRQVFLNLMGNAVEAMPQGGTLTIRTRTGQEGTIMAEVCDSGVGIPHENLGRMFTPFFTTKPVGKGTGLGLAISYGIIKMHRGKIEVHSEVGKGSTFTVTLPVKLPAAGDASALPGGSASGKLLIG